jgi:selenide,water dikinase
VETSDDAGVYRLNEETALIQTVDFFTPIVDDPYLFGAIAAANSFSDIYAMGGTPLTALNIIAFPMGVLPLEVLAEILRGGSSKIKEAGAVLLGGHSIQDNEPKYGLAVTGTARPGDIWTNAGAKDGNLLILTKPLGIGIITSALRKRKDREGNVEIDPSRLPPGVEKKAVDTMMELNAAAAAAGREVGLTACTDITGFGLLGHAWEMARGSGVEIEISLREVPVIEGTRELAVSGYIAGGNWKNLDYMEDKAEYFKGMEEADKHILVDPITSGGLLMAVEKKNGEKLLELLQKKGAGESRIIGRIKSGRPKIKVVP